MKPFLLMLSLLTLGLGSCSTLVNGERQEVVLEGEPEGTVISVNGEQKGADQVRLKLKRKQDHAITFENEDKGCETEQVNLTSQTQAGFIVFDVILCFPCLIIDGIVGSWYKLEDGRVFQKLDCDDAQSKAH